MKIKGLLISMLACTAMLVGCSDDVIDNVSSTESKKMDTYISISIESASSSSRGTTVGDGHTTTDDNTHHNDGVRTENTINELLVIVTPQDEEHEAAENTINGFVKILNSSQLSTTNGITTIKADDFPVRVDYIIPYKALVVVNPTTALKSAITSKTHKEAYAKVCEHSGDAYEDISANKDGSNLSFMMANKSEALIEPTEANQVETNPATTTVEVERVVSKVTFRPSKALTSAPESLGDNTHEVTVNVTNYKAVTERMWFKEEYTATIDGKEEQVTKYTYTTFNKANHSTDGEVWVYLTEGKTVDGGQVDANDVVGIFTKQYDSSNKLVEYEGYVETVKDDPTTTENESKKENKKAALLSEKTISDKESYLNSLTFITDQGTAGTNEKYYVKLEKYALTNLSNKVYAVRHVAPNGNFEKVKVPGGALNHNTDYIVDPWTIKKHDYTESSSTDTWFNRTYLDVFAEANNTNLTNWKNLPTITSTDEIDNTDGTSNSDHDGITNVGYFMDYIYENAVKSDMQLEGLITGIVVSAQIYAENGSKVPVMYKYNDKFYRTLKALLAANSGITGITENSTDDEADKVDGLDVYKGGKCYYYSSQIKHFDDGLDNNSGVMEFAIMRNNIYSLSISGVRNIGSATLKLTPGEPAEDKSAFITLTAKTLPWIVRFNNIQF